MTVEPITAILLASGLGRRFGGEISDPLADRFVLEGAAETISSMSCVNRLCVLPAREGLLAEIVEARGFTTIIDPHPEAGQGAALALAARHVPAEHAVLVALGNMPYVKARHLEVLLASHGERGREAITTSYGYGRIMPPTLFGSAHRSALLALQGDMSAAGIADTAGDVVTVLASAQELSRIDRNTELDGPPATDLSSARAISADIVAGRRTCADVAHQTLAHLAATKDLNALITVADDLPGQARRLDMARVAGDPIGSLHGVPVVIKDNIETRDMPTTGGVAALKDLRTGRDAPTVARLREAGALIVGKANLDELAIAGRGTSGCGGQTYNPHDVGRHPAGSSGGSAVAVATGVAALALGTETVNSLRYPASATGIIAIRPARGTVDRTHVMPQSALTDVVGPMARDVADAALMLDVLRGEAPRTYSTANPADLRIGILRAMFGDGNEHRGVNEALALIFDELAKAGATIIEIDDATFASAPLYTRLAVQVYEVADLMTGYLRDLAVAPSQRGLGASRTLADLAMSQPQAPLAGPFIAQAINASRDERGAAITRHRSEVADVERALRAHMTEHRLDALAYPLCQRPAARPIDEPSRPERNGILASALGWPAVDLPVGQVSEPGTSANLPVGLDLMTVPDREAYLIGIALTIEGLASQFAPFVRSPNGSASMTTTLALGDATISVPEVYQMRLTKQTAYALRIVMHCAAHSDRTVRTSELAEALHMTGANAIKTVRALVSHGFLTGVRGRAGGVKLAKPADRISVADIMRAMEPTRVEADCIGFDIACDLRTFSPLNRAFDEALKDFIKALEPHTIASLVEQQTARRPALVG